jgi:DNA-nicking Smr family endonuclease
MEIDLHGVKHEDVGRILDTFIWEQMKRKASGIKIITGNSPEMKKIVSDIVSEYGLIAVDSIGNSAAIIVNFI